MYKPSVLALLAACAILATTALFVISERRTCASVRTQHGIQMETVTRPYVLYTDPAQTNSPLVLVFHGGGGPMGSPERMIEYSGWKEIADSDCISVAFLTGSKMTDASEAQIDSDLPHYNPLVWNTVDNASADIEYVARVINDIQERASIEDARIYATGFSNGASFAYILAQALPDTIAAIAPIEAGPVHIDSAETNVSLISISGVPLELSRLPDAQAGTWASYAGCTSSSLTTRGTITEREWLGCPEISVREIFVGGMGHEYPGAAKLFGTHAAYTDAVSAAEEVWTFFKHSHQNESVEIER